MSRKLQSVSEFAEASGFTESQLRWWLFHRDTNGLCNQGAVKRIGRRVYIDPEAFDRWVDSMQQNAAASPAGAATRALAGTVDAMGGANARVGEGAQP